MWDNNKLDDQECFNCHLKSVKTNFRSGNMKNKFIAQKICSICGVAGPISKEYEDTAMCLNECYDLYNDLFKRIC